MFCVKVFSRWELDMFPDWGEFNPFDFTVFCSGCSSRPPNSLRLRFTPLRMSPSCWAIRKISKARWEIFHCD